MKNDEKWEILVTILIILLFLAVIAFIAGGCVYWISGGLIG